MPTEATAGNAQRIANRFFLTIAGRRLRAYSILIHTGRTSGRDYRNPVTAYPLGDGFVVPVLYGTGSHWVRNVMAAGRFTLRTKSQDIVLERPEIIPAGQALSAYPRLLRRTMTSRKIQSFVWAHRSSPDSPR